MPKFSSPLTEINEYNELLSAIKRKGGALQLSGCIDTESTYIASALAEGRKALWISCNDIKAAEICEDITGFGGEALVYPSKDLLFYESDVRGNYFDKQRMSLIRRLISGDKIFAVASVDSLMERIAPLSAVKHSSVVIGRGDTLELDGFERHLISLGYERYPQVDASGQFSVRGGIVDIYTLTEEMPVRIEFFGDEIDSIRSFDPETQRSLEALDVVEIFPAGEIKVAETQQVSLLDYFDEDTLIFAEEPVRLLEKARMVAEEYQEAVGRRIADGLIKANDAETLFSVHDIFEKLERRSVICMTGLAQKCEELRLSRTFCIQAQSVPAYMGQVETMVSDLKNQMRANARVVLFSGSQTRAQRLAENLRDYEINAYYSERDEVQAAPGSVLVLSGSIHRGFVLPMLSYYVLSDSDLFGRKQKKRRRGADKQGRKITELSSLGIGDYVIHENHGLGIYKGTERKTMSGVSRDYMKITYGDGGNLYVPVTQMDLVQKYADANADSVPKLNRLAGNEWSRTKARVKHAVSEIAEDLVALYARRERASGMKYGEDTVWQREFEEQFPFEETEDQLAAIEAVKQDMESGRVMDRLICGDVGFGKTEIAIRAAFKAVQDGRQVAYLVPTTILAQQHFNTFTQRLNNYAVNTELLCRFRTAAEQKKTVARLRSGETDVVIGTHRLLSADISFKNLGLLIIDEEQRFGVADKEKIKKLRENVDVLSLTATPIPRTLHMSLVGVRDMSILKEAPLDRVPIQTYVMEYNEELVREAIMRELARGGQVYYVYNKVESIRDMTDTIQKLVPDASVAFAHGKMREHELEDIMLDFINGEIDVLVSTTIVETGIDISNVNTILIHDADRFGLAQLYQLRGRVGRSNRCAYAFLLYRPGKMLTEIAEKRLSTIREFTELGSGIKISMKDLELRGAGNMLGLSQSGHMEAVGYDLYSKMLGTAVRELTGETGKRLEFETSIELALNAYLPEEYVKSEKLRLSLYKRIAGIENEEDMSDVQDELIDRFGEIPTPVQNLLRVALVKALAHEAYVTEISGDRTTLVFKMEPHAPVNTMRIGPFLSVHKGDVRITNGDVVSFTYYDQRRRNTEDSEMLRTIAELIGEIKELMEEET